MPRKRANNNISTQTFSSEIPKHETTMQEIQNSIQKIEEDYRVEIAKIESNFAVFDREYSKTYTQYENDYSAAIAYVNQQYGLLFDALSSDLEDNSHISTHAISRENNEYDSIISKFESLLNQANKKYLDLCKESESYIDRESTIHHSFIKEEDKRFEKMFKSYSSINNRQYDTLLWSIEKSKNALNDLSKKLNDQSFNDAKFMTTSVIKTIEDLRSTKNNITVLFKTTTQVFSQKKKVIDDLSLVRQKPHSVLNQKLINQFVEQIQSVNDQRNSFELLVKEDLNKSIKTIGQKMIAADKDNNRKLTQKYIMQYQIVNSKAEFLLKRNREMSDLLIQKYQNEIKKIKIDSFRRVEEIKLAYYMPSEFFQNSINLYSNFAFYINESMDEIDNMLSDFIRFNQNIAQSASDYIFTSSKIFEDYKINLLVTVNDVTNRLTDLITNVDKISKDIIELESKNRLEIAEIRKEMENLDITSDYEKYLKSLEYDRFFADYQHEINIHKLQLEFDKNEKLLSIQKELTDKNKERDLDEVHMKHAKLISTLERQIHESSLDKQFMIAETMHRRIVSLLEAEHKRTDAVNEINKSRQQYVILKGIDNQIKEYESIEKQGNDYVVEYIHDSQKLIDLHKQKTNKAKEYVENDSHQYRYARILEKERQLTMDYHNKKYDDLTLPNRQAVTYLSQFLFKTHDHLKKRIQSISYHIKNMLVNLNAETALLQFKALESSNYYRQDFYYSLNSASETLNSVIESCHIRNHFDNIEKPIELFIYRFSQLSDEISSLAKHPHKIKKYHGYIENFYIESLLLIEDYLMFLLVFFNTALEKSIEYDVINIHTKKINQFNEQDIINNSYENRIYQAANKNHKVNHFITSLDQEYAEFELIMKEKVYQLNLVFLKMLDKEKNKLAYIKSELSREVENIDRNHLKDVNIIAKSIEKKILDAQKYFIEIENDYKAKKALLFQDNEQMMNSFDQTQSHSEEQRSLYLSQLNQSIMTLPQVQNKEIELMESNKLNLINERKAILNRELTEIEEKKLLATPKYLEKIEAVKSRLPNDYLKLYKEISVAQEQLIKEHRNIETTYQQNFGRFIGNQMEYNSILFNDSVILHSFDKEMETTGKIIIKSNELFQDTIEKSNLTQEKIVKKSVESNEKQKRVINV